MLQGEHSPLQRQSPRGKQILKKKNKYLKFKKIDHCWLFCCFALFACFFFFIAEARAPCCPVSALGDWLGTCVTPALVG